jgi:hypothetical protein
MKAEFAIKLGGTSLILNRYPFTQLSLVEVENVVQQLRKVFTENTYPICVILTDEISGQEIVVPFPEGE